MENKSEKNIDALTCKLLDNAFPESVSSDFTSRVMMEVHALQKKKSYSYQPPISRSGWITIFVMMGGLVVWLLLGPEKVNTIAGANENLNYVNKLIGFFNSFQLSDDIARILLLASAMMGVQLILLYRYLNGKSFQW